MKKKRVLSEEEYLDTLRHVIGRQFFPEVPRQTSPKNSRIHTHKDKVKATSLLPQPVSTLQSFLSEYVSEDNVSFHEIMDREAERRRRWFARHFVRRTAQNTPMLKYTRTDPSTALFGTLGSSILPPQDEKKLDIPLLVNLRQENPTTNLICKNSESIQDPSYLAPSQASIEIQNMRLESTASNPSVDYLNPSDSHFNLDPPSMSSRKRSFIE
jgi:hypothetical protein